MFIALLLALAPSALAQQTCTFSLNPASRSVPATPDTIGTIVVTASSSTCARTAVTDSPEWLTISFGNTGTGNGSIGYRVDTSDVAQIRTGSITVGNARFTVTQAAAACTLDLSPLSARVTAQAGGGSIRVTTRCRWAATSSIPWLTTASSGSGDGTVSYSYEANPSTSPRSGTIAIGTRTFSLTQDGIPCTTRLSPTSADFPGDGGRGVVAVTSNCAWRATPSQTWISLVGAASATGNGSVTYTVASSTSPSSRAGAITIGDQVFAIRQAESTLPHITAVKNLASGSPDIAPGTLVSIAGTRLGESGTRVLVDGIEAVVMQASAEQVIATIPKETEPRRSASIVVEFEGRPSLPFTVPIATTAPATFTLDGSGIGQATAFYTDLSLNTVINPAQKLSLITLFITGAGTELPPPSGWSVSIGGALAEVVYAGAAPGLPSGVVQLNVLVPQAAPLGNEIPLFLILGGAVSQQGVTIAVQ
jgi:uncharacterized protein (TIGR03437 family)